MLIRLSTEKDREDIDALMLMCFGVRSPEKVFTNLNGRYLLAYEDNRLVGMTGLLWSEEYEAFELDWTCTRPDYRKQGVMHKLFDRVCNFTDEKIYCSCWRFGGNEKVNLHSLMKDYGFEEVLRPRAAWRCGVNCSLDFICCGRGNKGTDCYCYEDLYIRKARTTNV